MSGVKRITVTELAEWGKNKDFGSETLRFNVCSVITDRRKFFESHIAVLEAGRNRPKDRRAGLRPYYDRFSTILQQNRGGGMTKRQKIVNLITEIRNSHSRTVEIYTGGSCLNFHLILRSVFQEAKPYYNSNHIVTEIDGTFYDITGVVHNRGEYLPFEGYFDKKGTRRAFNQMYRAEFTIN